ncbi:endonuclease/exonuclease/phosphatase family protein [Vibrio tapetis]|uniref:Putative DNase I-like family n=1 Tax=Vibrio tapetis subsp. tapetis TaxID=1671868 RepID=A0A2N8ZKS6_9VIBR|nr:endonuclease/exonuclease/phosphatase family protein [Vibrio tapetis]SON52513.1 putative DNase I-like family [Vibrio tapetis subsp. tapetis]
MATPSIRIATFNLLNYIAPPDAYYDFINIYSEQEWQGKEQWMLGALTEANADVIAFQEVFSPKELQALCARAGYRFFSVCDLPQQESDYVYSKPVVALASKWPISNAKSVSSKHATKMPKSFQFSRRPLHAQVQMPQFGLTDFYVVHLKSQRSTDTQDDEQYSQQNRHVYGQWLSSFQRHEEADALKQIMRANKRMNARPAIVLGDFNQRLTSDSLHDLVDPMPTDAMRLKQKTDLFLSDSWDIYIRSFHAFTGEGEANAQDLKSTPIRPASHYWGETGSVLDYILMSQEFDHVSQHQTIDKHLVEPIFSRDRYATDHGIVVISI